MRTIAPSLWPVLLVTGLLAEPGPARAETYRLTAADGAEIERLLRTFFEAVRDGNARATAAALPTEAEFTTLFARGAEPFSERHRRAFERDARDLRARFAGGSWAGLAEGFGPGQSITVSRCGRFAAPASRCVDGPVIQWRAGSALRRMRIDRLVRVRGHWKIFDARL